MITRVKGKYFKGIPEFDQPLGRLNLIVGLNGSGKSARSHALQLVIQGHILGVGKQNAAIFAACSTSEDTKIFVECAANKSRFLKRYVRSDKDGSVSLDYMVDDRKAAVAAYSAAMVRSDMPRIVDLSSFMALSDTKKIEELFSLFPPDGDLSSLTADIEAAKERLNAKIKEVSAKENMVAALSQSLARMELGAGTLADIQTEGVETAAALEAAKEALAEEKSRIATDLAKAKAEADHKAAMQRLNEQAVSEAVAKQKESDEKYQALIRRTDEVNAENARAREQTSDVRLNPEVEAAEARLRQNAKKIGAEISGRNPLMAQHIAKMEEITGQTSSAICTTPIEKIISVLQRTGCTTCAALMVAKRELRDLKGGVNA